MASELKSLAEHNSITSTVHRGLFPEKPVPNGIACPKCGEELLDSKPNEILTSIPPQKSVKCSNDKCDFNGYRVA